MHIVIVQCVLWSCNVVIRASASQRKTCTRMKMNNGDIYDQYEND